MYVTYRINTQCSMRHSNKNFLDMEFPGKGLLSTSLLSILQATRACHFHYNATHMLVKMLRYFLQVIYIPCLVSLAEVIIDRIP